MLFIHRFIYSLLINIHLYMYRVVQLLFTNVKNTEEWPMLNIFSSLSYLRYNICIQALSVTHAGLTSLP